MECKRGWVGKNGDVPYASCGRIIANEVCLDCQHHLNLATRSEGPTEATKTQVAPAHGKHEPNCAVRRQDECQLNCDCSYEPQNRVVDAIFSTDHRVLERAKAKHEVDATDKRTLVVAVQKARKLAEEGVQPEAGWLQEARELSERVGKVWSPDQACTAPPVVQSQLVEALREREGLTPMGFPPTEIAACGQATICTEPYVTFRPQYLLIDPAVAGLIGVESIRIGKNCQEANSHPIPGSVFSALAFPFRLQLDTVQVGQRVQLCIVNYAPSSVFLNMCMLGKVVT